MKGVLEKTNRGWTVKTVLAEGEDVHMIRVYPLIKFDVDSLEPATDWYLGKTLEDSLSFPLPSNLGVLLYRCVYR